MISDLEFGIADLAPTYRPLAQATFASGFLDPLFAPDFEFRNPEFEIQSAFWR